MLFPGIINVLLRVIDFAGCRCPSAERTADRNMPDKGMLVHAVVAAVAGVAGGAALGHQRVGEVV